MSKKNQKLQTRTIYVKSDVHSKEGFDSYEEASTELAKMVSTGKIPQDARSRVRFRRRTSKYDIVVKLQTEVKASEEPKLDGPYSPKEDQEFIARHALTGE